MYYYANAAYAKRQIIFRRKYKWNRQESLSLRKLPETFVSARSKQYTLQAQAIRADRFLSQTSFLISILKK